MDADRLSIFFFKLLAAVPALAPVGAIFANASTARSVLLLTLGISDNAITKPCTPVVRAGRLAAALDILLPNVAIPDRAVTIATVPACTAGAWDICAINRPISADNSGRYCCTADRLPADADSCANELNILLVPADTLSAPDNEAVNPWNAVPIPFSADRSAPDINCKPRPRDSRFMLCSLLRALTERLISVAFICDSLAAESAKPLIPLPRDSRPEKSPSICNLEKLRSDILLRASPASLILLPD